MGRNESKATADALDVCTGRSTARPPVGLRPQTVSARRGVRRGHAHPGSVLPLVEEVGEFHRRTFTTVAQAEAENCGRLRPGKMLLLFQIRAQEASQRLREFWGKAVRLRSGANKCRRLSSTAASIPVKLPTWLGHTKISPFVLPCKSDLESLTLIRIGVLKLLIPPGNSPSACVFAKLLQVLFPFALRKLIFRHRNQYNNQYVTAAIQRYVSSEREERRRPDRPSPSAQACS